MKNYCMKNNYLKNEFGCPKKNDMILIFNNCFRFQDYFTFTSNHSKKEVLNFVFDVLFRQLRETHRIKGFDKNVTLFLIF